jgi:hypothetical protein
MVSLFERCYEVYNVDSLVINFLNYCCLDSKVVSNIKIEFVSCGPINYSVSEYLKSAFKFNIYAILMRSKLSVSNLRSFAWRKPDSANDSLEVISKIAAI